MVTNKAGYMKNYYNNNEKFRIKMLEREFCTYCNKSCTHVSMYRHKKTKTHIRNTLKNKPI